MNKDSRTKNTAKNLAVSLLCQFLLIFVKFACRTVFIQTLGKSYLGINGLFSDILTMLSITELGLDSAMNYKLYKPLAENDIPRLQVLMKFYKTAYFIVGSSILLLGTALIPFMPKLIKDYDGLGSLGINPELLFVLYLLQSALSYMFFASDSAIIKADQKEYVVNLSNFFCRLIMNICQIIVLWLWTDFLLYVVLEVIFSVVQNGINALIAHRLYKNVFQKTKDRISLKEIEDMLKDLGAISLGKIKNVVLNATDNLVLSAFIGLIVVGMYSNYLLIYVTIKTLLHRVFSATKASMGNLFAEADVEKKYQFFNVMNFITIFFYGTAAVGIAVVVDELIMVWIGSDYIIGFPFSVLLGFEVLSLGIKQNLYQTEEAAGIFRKAWYRALISIGVNITVSLLLVRICGIYGVLIGTLVADITSDLLITPIIVYKFALKGIKSPIDFFLKNAILLGVVGFVGVVDWVMCHFILVDKGWISVFTHAIICGVSVPCALMLFFRKTNECKYIYGLANKVLGKYRKH